MAQSSVASTHLGPAGSRARRSSYGDVTKRDLLQLDCHLWRRDRSGRYRIWPLVDSMNPSKDVLALSSVDVDLAPVVEGQGITIVWQGKPIFVRHRTPTEIKEAQDVRAGPVDRASKSDSAQEPRPGHDQWIVLIGICTHLGCVPLGNKPSDPARRVGRLVLPLPWQPV